MVAAAVMEALAPPVAWRPEHAGRTPFRGPGLPPRVEVADLASWNSRQRPEAVEGRFRFGRRRRQAAGPAWRRATLAGLAVAVPLVTARRELARTERVQVEEPAWPQRGNSFEAPSEPRGWLAKGPLLAKREAEVARAAPVPRVRPLQAECWELRARPERKERARPEPRRRLVAGVDWLVRCRLRRTPDRPRLVASHHAGVQRRICISRRRRKKF
jgi:hypothetical protein